MTNKSRIVTIISRTVEIIGAIFYLTPLFFALSRGQDISGYLFRKVISMLNTTLFLRRVLPWFFYISLGFLAIFFVMLSKVVRIDSTSSKQITYTRLLSRLVLGYFIMDFLFFLALDSQFFRGGFVSYRYLLGFLFFLILGILVLTDFNLHQLIVKSKDEDKGVDWNLGEIRNITGYLLVFGLVLFLIIPTLVPLSGFVPQPPDSPEKYGETGDYEVSMIRIEHEVPQNISQYLVADNNNDSWYIYIFLPKLDEPRNLPLAFYLHGYSGTNIDDYDRTMKSLASYGMISIFVQYVTTVKLEGEFSEPEDTNSTATNALYIRYLMEWSGILQAIDTITGRDAISNDTLRDTIGSEYSLDFDRIFVGGHSMGGGMTPYIATKVVKEGWGSKQLLLDMEAPWYQATHPLIEINLDVLPTHTIANIMGNEDDHLVSPCIGMQHFERIRSASGSDNLAYLIAHSDRYGFPRLVATHYLPADPVYDQLSQWGYFKRINAMADFLHLTSNGETNTEDIEAYFIGGNAEMRSMGNWSDTTPVTPLTYSQDPFGTRGGKDLAQSFIDTHENGVQVCQI